MFLQLANILQRRNRDATPEQIADSILAIDAASLRHVLETAWQLSGRSSVGGLSVPVPLATVAGVPSMEAVRRRLPQLHLIFAYMVEQTLIHRIFRRVVWEYVHGEKLGMPVSAVTQRWLSTTEELFFRDGSFHPLNLMSLVRPDQEAARRNAYYRLFGMDLNHGAEGGGAYTYIKPDAATREFVAVFEDFLREVWQGIENASNTSGANKTDTSAIENRAIRLENMLNARRGGTPTSGVLARDEFVHVSTMAWFALTVQADTAVVRDLKAGAPSPEERLRQIGERVGVPSHARSHSYFRLAVPLATLLIQIEQGTYSTPGSAPTLYAPGTVRDNLQLIVTHWSAITGRDLKGPRVTVGAPPPATSAMQPGTRAVAVAAAAENGRSPAVVRS